MSDRPDVVVIMTDEERAVPPYEAASVLAWRDRMLAGRRWFDDHGVSFHRHYTGSLACVPSRPTIFTGHYPDLHGVTQTDGIGKTADDSRMRWLRPGEVPTLGNWFRAAGYDTHYDGKWHISHADLIDPATGRPLATNDDDGVIDAAAVQRYLDADPLGPFGFSGWVGPEPHGALLANAGIRRDPLIADRVVAWLERPVRASPPGDAEAMRPFLLVASFVNPARHRAVSDMGAAWSGTAVTAGPAVGPAAPTADEDLSTKPAAQIAFREAYYSGYGPAPAINLTYDRYAQRYRDLYYRLHAEVDGPIDRVRRAVTEGGSDERGTGAHGRSRRSARRPRRAAPEVVQPVRRSHPRSVRDRAHRCLCDVVSRGDGADVARRLGPDAAGGCGCRCLRRWRLRFRSRSPRCTICRAAT